MFLYAFDYKKGRKTAWLTGKYRKSGSDRAGPALLSEFA